MSDRGRLAGDVYGWVSEGSEVDFADFLIAKGYGRIHVETAAALEQAAQALIEVATENWEISDVVDFLYERATAIYVEGA